MSEKDYRTAAERRFDGTVLDDRARTKTGVRSYMNSVNLMGMVVSAPKFFEPKATIRCPMLQFRLYLAGRGANFVTVRTYHDLSVRLSSLLRRNDQVLLRGTLRTRMEARPGGLDRQHTVFVAASFLQIIPIVPRSFLRGHVVVPEDVYNRLCMLAKDYSEAEIPRSIREHLAGQVAEDNGEILSQDELNLLRRAMEEERVVSAKDP